MKSRLMIAAAMLLVSVSMADEVHPEKPGHLGGYIAVGDSPEYLKGWVRAGSPTVPLARIFHVGDTVPKSAGNTPTVR